MAKTPNIETLADGKSVVKRVGSLQWPMWLATDACLAAGLFIDDRAIQAAILMTAIQTPVIAITRSEVRSFPAQVRLAFMSMLVAGMWTPLSFLHWIQLFGLSSMLIFDYCFLARCLSLAPGNRRVPLTWKLVAETFFSAPVRGSFIASMRSREILL